jgi:hypothetical protein
MIILDDPQALLYIEPQNPPSAEPLVDEYTRHMTGLLDAHENTGCYMSGRFYPHDAFRGWHTCSCGVWSTNVDYLLPGGLITNSLAVHYLAFHRDEVPTVMLERVMTTSSSIAPENPTPEHLQEPPTSDCSATRH